MLRQSSELGVEVAGQHLVQSLGRVESGDSPGAVQLVADVVEPDLLAVGRVQERHAELALVPRLLIDALRVALSLGQDALRAERQLLGLDDAEGTPAIAERVVSRAVGGLELLDSRPLVLTRIRAAEWHYVPPGLPEPGVDSFLPGCAFRCHVAFCLTLW